MAYKKAQFKTAYLQREIPVQAAVAEDLVVGALCTFDGTNITGATTATVGNYIVAQSDVTMGASHVPVEHHDWRYSNKVAASTTPKNVALFRITDASDVIVEA